MENAAFGGILYTMAVVDWWWWCVYVEAVASGISLRICWPSIRVITGRTDEISAKFYPYRDY